MSALWRPTSVSFPFSKGSGFSHPAVLSNLAYTRQKLDSAPDVCMVDQCNCSAFWAWQISFYEVQETFGSLLRSIRRELETILGRKVSRMDALSLYETPEGNFALSVSTPYDTGKQCSCLFIVNAGLTAVISLKAESTAACVSNSCTDAVCKLVGNLLKFCSRVTCVGVDLLTVNLSAFSDAVTGHALFNYERLGKECRFYYGLYIQKARPFYSSFSDVNECILVV